MKINCEYCDSIIDTEVDKKCPNCNASYAKNKEYKEYIRKEKEEAARMEEFTNQVKERVISQFKVNQKVSKVVFIVASIIILIIFIVIITTILKMKF